MKKCPKCQHLLYPAGYELYLNQYTLNKVVNNLKPNEKLNEFLKNAIKKEIELREIKDQKW